MIEGQQNYIIVYAEIFRGGMISLVGQVLKLDDCLIFVLINTLTNKKSAFERQD